jgi:hypothetical protein
MIFVIDSRLTGVSQLGKDEPITKVKRNIRPLYKPWCINITPNHPFYHQLIQI